MRWWWLNPWGEVKAQKRLNARQVTTIAELFYELETTKDRVSDLQAELASMNKDKWRQARELNRQLRETIARRDTSISRAHKLVTQKNAEIAQLRREVARLTTDPASAEDVFHDPSEPIGPELGPRSFDLSEHMPVKPILNEGSPPYVCPSCQGRDGLHGESCPVPTLGPQGAKEPVTRTADDDVLTGTAREIERAIKAGAGGPVMRLPKSTKEIER